MIDFHYWTTPNGHKIAVFLEESGLDYKIATRPAVQRAYALAKEVNPNAPANPPAPCSGQPVASNAN